MYRLTTTATIVRIEDNAFIPADPANTDYAAYLAWVDEGNTPDPAPQEELEAPVRRQRDALLVASDNRALADRWASMTTQQQQAWAQYRQELRDVPEQPGFPQTVVWPTPPQ
jgi:hypothetical protein